jgi:hypothetical protein
LHHRRWRVYHQHRTFIDRSLDEKFGPTADDTRLPWDVSAPFANSLCWRSEMPMRFGQDRFDRTAATNGRSPRDDLEHKSLLIGRTISADPSMRNLLVYPLQLAVCWLRVCQVREYSLTSIQRIIAVALGLTAALWLNVASAQVPPHVPGTVCFTPSFWCWAETQGEPGSPCKCGAVDGILG